MSMESLKLYKIGLDGLHRHDLKPNMDMKQYSLRSYYNSDLVNKTGSTRPTTNGLGGKPVPQPLFTVKGVQNISSLPVGDPRVVRVVSYYRETYVDPAGRAAIAPQFDHVQEGEAVHDDNDLGPSNTAPAAEGELGLAECDLLEKRRRYYREAVEGLDVRRVDAAESELREKLRASAFGPPGSYHLRGTFRFFDQDARGAIDLR